MQSLSLSLFPGRSLAIDAVLSSLDWALSPSAWLWQQVGFPCGWGVSVDQTVVGQGTTEPIDMHIHHYRPVSFLLTCMWLGNHAKAVLNHG